MCRALQIGGAIVKVPQIPPLPGCTPLGLIPETDLPFNLSGESQSSDLTAEAEARVRALAAAEARKAQLSIDFQLGIDGVPYGD